MRSTGRAAITALALAAPLIIAPAATAAATTAPGAPTRGDIIATCSIPRVPAGSTLVSSRSSKGVLVRTYSIAGQLPVAAGVYYMGALPRHGYQILGWGAGGSNVEPGAGTGFGISAYAKQCGYVGISLGAGKQPPTRLEVCTGRTRAALTACSNSHHATRR